MGIGVQQVFRSSRDRRVGSVTAGFTMINIFSPGLALVLAGWVVAVSGWRVGGGRVCRPNWRVADLPTLPNPARNTILAMSPLGSSLPISSIQSQIGAVEVRIEGVQAQIAEVAEAVKAVQSQVVDVAAKIEKTEAALDAADLSSEKRVVLVMKLKSLMDKEAKLIDKEAKLMGKEAILNDRLNILFGKDRLPGPELVWNAERVTLGPAVDWGSLKIGDVVAVPLAHSGLSDNKPVQQLYVRRACLELSKFLRDLSTNVQLVTGCPGVGKSIEVFSFAFEQAQLHHKRVLYVHGDTKSGISVIFKDEPSIATARLARQTFSLEPEALNLFVDSVLREGLVDLVVLDGSLSWLIMKVFLKMDEFPSAKLVTCTSFQAPGKMSQEVSMKCAPRRRFVMDSWQEDELYAALDVGALSLSPGTTKSEMFYYAGGSVRLFQASVKDVESELESKISAVPDMSKLVGSGGVGDSSADATNSLMAMYSGKSVVLSQFVMRKLMDRVSIDFIQKARYFLPNNPSWQGWLVEAEVMHMARTRKNLSFRNDSSEPRVTETWQAEVGVISFEDVAELAGGNLKVGWYQPTRWNQKGYDALFRVSRDKLRIIQISMSTKSRKFNLKDAIPLAQAMNTHEVELVLICGKQTFSSVEITASGGTKELKASLKKTADAKAIPTNEQTAWITFRTVCYQLD